MHPSKVKLNWFFLNSLFFSLQLSNANLQQGKGMKVMCKTGSDGCLSITRTTTVVTSYEYVVCGNLVEENIGYKGAANIKSFNDGSVTDFNSCAQECADFEGCNFWTFTSGGNCHLKGSDNGRENRAGFTSGQKPCS